MRWTHRVAALLVALACVSCDKTQKPAVDVTAAPVPKVDMPANSDVQPLAKSNNAFGFDLWRLVGRRAGNLTVSPASLSTALAMTWGGAKGETEQQMRRVLHLQGEQDAVAARWGQVSLALQNPSRELKLRIANRLFGEKSFRFEQPFLDKTRERFAAPLEAIDFASSPEPSRLHINAWVEAQTERRIKNLLPLRSIKSNTRMVLVNAIYFLADWESQFKKESTMDRPFQVSPTQTKNVPMLHQMKQLRVAQGDGVRVLELPYKGDDAAMLIVLPDRIDGLADVEKDLSVDKLDAWRAGLAPQNVMVALPRFEINPQASIPMRASLEELGITDAYDPATADFTAIGIPPNPRFRLCISEAFHKAFVKVDEKGTEAAAATAVVMGAAGAHAMPKVEVLEFRADHPFLFFIMDKPTGLVLFMGRVADPSSRG